MHRLIVVILAAVDAAIAAAVGIAAALAPLTLLWVLGMAGTADWGTLWPASAAIWQLGNLVPLQITLPGDYLAAAGIDPGAASFALTLAPLAFAAFTAIFAARSGVRASRADAWGTGVITGSVVFAALTALIAVTSGGDLAAVQLWQAILFPALVFAAPLLVSAAITEWCEAGSGWLSRVRDRVELPRARWGPVIGLTVRGTAVALVGLLGLGALVFATALVLRGGEVIALFESAHVDVLGAVVVTLGQLAYLPTLVVWGMSFVAGPGFAVGVGTAVSPAGTQLGVIPGIPVLGVLPESTTPWLLLLVLLPIAVGAFAGWVTRSRLSADRFEPFLPRLVIALGIAVLSAGGAALLAMVASGSIGPGRLAEVGPQPGPVALAVGLEVLVGAAILLLSPRRRVREMAGSSEPDAAPADPMADSRESVGAVSADVVPPDAADTDVIEPLTSPLPEPEAPTVDLGLRRPGPLPPVD
jgi:hypothetical protein